MNIFKFRFVLKGKKERKKEFMEICWCDTCTCNSRLDEFGNDCPILTKDLTEYDEIYVEYNGKDVSSSCNKFKFRGRGEKSLDEYSICVTPLYFNDRTCAVEVDIMTSFSAEATEVCMHEYLTLKAY